MVGYRSIAIAILLIPLLVAYVVQNTSVNQNRIRSVVLVKTSRANNDTDTLYIPEALLNVTFQGCCGEENPFDDTCLTERACENNTLYPFRSQQEAELFAPWNASSRERQEHKQQCMAAMETLEPPTRWCSNDARFPFGCSQYSMNGRSGPYDRLLLFPGAKLAFCGIPKTGITKWIQFLRFTLGAKDYQTFPHFKLDYHTFRFDKLRPEVQQEIWGGEWTKAIFIREPAERLLSAFLDKVERKERWNLTFDQFVGSLEMKNITNAMHGVTWFMNPHWRPQAWACGLSEHMEDFDYIGTVDDHLGNHTKALLTKVGLWEHFGKHYRVNVEGSNRQKLVIPPPAPGDAVKVGFFQGMNTDIQGHNMGSRKRMDEYYTPELLERVKKLYWMDVRLWDALQEAAKEGLVTGKDIVGKLNPECNTA